MSNVKLGRARRKLSSAGELICVTPIAFLDLPYLITP
jgi:hypothetical protein